MPDTRPPYRGYYINLESSPQRRAALECQLLHAGCSHRYARFAAVDGKAKHAGYNTRLTPGELGCWLSHVGVLREAARGNSHVHVLEDDVLLAENAPCFLEMLLRHADERVPDWDLIFTEIFVPLTSSAFALLSPPLHAYLRGGDCTLVPLDGVPFAGATSYFVNRNSVARVRSLLEERFDTGYPVDLVYRDLTLEGRIKSYVSIPFLTTLSAHNEVSCIRGDADRSQAVANLYRRAYFKDADLAALGAQMMALTQNAALTPCFCEPWGFASATRGRHSDLPLQRFQHFRSRDGRHTCRDYSQWAFELCEKDYHLTREAPPHRPPPSRWMYSLRVGLTSTTTSTTITTLLGN